jgi:tetratricopeptide (TPR) repeat protein
MQGFTLVSKTKYLVGCWSMALSFTLSQTFIQIAESKGNTKNADEKAFHTVIYKALAGERWKVCVQVCDDYLAKHKTDPLARALRGYSLIEVSRDAEAAADLTAALAGGVTTIPISIAEDHCNNVLALRGFALLRLGKLKEGIADIEKSLNKSMLLSEYLNQKIDYTNLSTAYRKLGDAKKSAYYQQLSAERDKDTLRCYMPNQTDNASLVKYVKEQRAYLAKHPDDNVQTVKMAANLLFLNKPAEALTYIDRAIAKEPFLMRSRFLRVEILQKLNRQSDAKPDLDEVLKNLERPSGSAVTAGGRLTLAARVVEFYRKTGNVDGQIKAYECLVRTGSAGEPQLYDLAQCYALKKQWAKAIETYTEALDYAVDNRPLIYEQRAKAHRALGHLKEAKADEAEAGRSRQRGQKL